MNGVLGTTDNSLDIIACMGSCWLSETHHFQEFQSARMEKVEILELAVKHLREIRRRRLLINRGKSGLCVGRTKGPELYVAVWGHFNAVIFELTSKHEHL